MTPAELKKFKEIVTDPVKWTQVFLTTFDGALKREVHVGIKQKCLEIIH